MTYSEAIHTLARAIATAEGFYSSSPTVIPRRAHNPGDLKLPQSLSPLGYDKGHTRFATDEDGWAALYRQLQMIVDGRSNKYTLSMTLEDMAKQYAENWRPWATIVSRELGVSPATTLRQILADAPPAVPRVSPDRAPLLTILGAMPEEAFSWFVGWALTGYPDGLGGFQPASRTSIEALRAAAKTYGEGS